VTIRYPAPLQPGDRIGVTAPSSGVSAALRPRLDFCVEVLRRKGYDVVVGDCMDGEGVVSGPASARAAELTAMLTDPSVRAVVPPWGGELAVELLPHLDFGAIGTAEPTWLVGYSDISTLLLPLTTTTGVATLHGQNLMDTPYRVPAPLASWLDVATLSPGRQVSQGASSHHRSGGFDDWGKDPTITEFTLDAPGGWQLLDPGMGSVSASGRLIGGCLETVSVVAGTRWGNVPAFAAEHAPEGLVVYVDVCEHGALDVARDLWRLRLAGWFENATAVLVSRTHAPAAPGFSQQDAVRSALGDLDLPVVLDVDCGHVPPHLALVNGAQVEVTVGSRQALVQTLT
jgi:muramoyltetrapeptide carboxypeptidase